MSHPLFLIWLSLKYHSAFGIPSCNGPPESHEPEMCAGVMGQHDIERDVTFHHPFSSYICAGYQRELEKIGREVFCAAKRVKSKLELERHTHRVPLETVEFAIYAPAFATVDRFNQPGP